MMLTRVVTTIVDPPPELQQFVRSLNVVQLASCFLFTFTVAAAAAFYVKPHEAKMLLPKSLARNTKFFPCQVRQLFVVVFPVAPFLPQDTHTRARMEWSPCNKYVLDGCDKKKTN